MSEKNDSAGASNDEARPLAVEEPIRVKSTPLMLILLLAVGIVLALAKPVVLAVAFAWLFKVALTPIVRALARVGIPISIGAALTLLVIMGSAGYGIYRLAAPASEWMDQLPHSIDRIAVKLGELREPLAKVSEATKQVEQIADGADDAGEAVKVEVTNQNGEGLLQSIFSSASALLMGVVVTIALLYFMLASDDVFLGKVVEALPRLQDGKQAVASVRIIEKRIAHYVLTVSLINLGLGVAVGVGFAALGMPNPALWGAMAGMMNFVPYLGAAVGISVVCAVALLTFDTIAEALVPPLFYLVLNVLEGLIITPLILGRSFVLSPVAIFLWLMVCGWIWGIPGALLAVPLLMALKIFCEHVPSLHTVARFLDR